MVNFHDPVVQDKEFSACVPLTVTSSGFSPKPEDNWTHFPDALKWFWALMDGIFMWVWLLLAFAASMCHLTQFSLALTVGSF